MKEIKATIVKRTKGGYLVGVAPGVEKEFETAMRLKLGQVVWAGYNFVDDKIGTLSLSPGLETPSPLNLPEPEETMVHEEVTSPIVYDEEFPVIEGETWPEIDGEE
jgi:hypothetical protein